MTGSMFILMRDVPWEGHSPKEKYNGYPTREAAEAVADLANKIARVRSQGKYAADVVRVAEVVPFVEAT